jgi:hypothetical protein
MLYCISHTGGLKREPVDANKHLDSAKTRRGELSPGLEYCTQCTYFLGVGVGVGVVGGVRLCCVSQSYPGPAQPPRTIRQLLISNYYSTVTVEYNTAYHPPTCPTLYFFFSFTPLNLHASHPPFLSPLTILILHSSHPPPYSSPSTHPPLYSSSTLFILHFVHPTLCSSTTLSILQSTNFLLCSSSTLFLLHSVHPPLCPSFNLLIFYSTHPPLYSSSTVFILHSTHSQLHSFILYSSYPILVLHYIPQLYSPSSLLLNSAYLNFTSLYSSTLLILHSIHPPLCSTSTLHIHMSHLIQPSRSHSSLLTFCTSFHPLHSYLIQYNSPIFPRSSSFSL